MRLGQEEEPAKETEKEQLSEVEERQEPGVLKPGVLGRRGR